METNKTLIYFRRFSLLLLAIVVLAGCKKENIEEADEQPLQEGPSMSVNVEAHFELPDDLQKSFLKDNVVEWEDGDQIRLNNDVLTIHRHEGGVGYFQGNATAYTNPSTYYNEWFAVYPKELAASGSLLKSGSRQIHVNIPQTQYYQEVDETNSKYLKDMNYMIAYTTASNNGSISLQFVNLCAVLKIGLTKGPTHTQTNGTHLDNTDSKQNARVKKIVLYTSHSEKAAFWGDGYVNSGDNTALAGVTDNLASLPSIQIEVAGATNNNRKLILDCVHDASGAVANANGVTLSTDADHPTWFYIMVPINLIGKKLSSMCIEVYDGNGNMMKKILKGTNIQRNKIYTSNLGSLQCQYAASSFIDADFSVSATQTVKFTSGNLQYHCKNNKWRFAENQYDRIGFKNNNVTQSTNRWIDLFSYGTSGKEKPPYYYSSNENDFPKGPITGTDNDWGWFNKIDGHPQHAFFLWNRSQVLYLLKTRTASKVSVISNARYAIGKVDSINGLFLFPDVYTLPDGYTIYSNNINVNSDNVTSLPSSGVSHSNVHLTAAQLSSSGMVFLPCGGMKDGNNVIAQSSGHYNQATCIERYANYQISERGYNLYICWPINNNANSATSGTSVVCYNTSYSYAFTGRSVRLILSNY